MFITELLFALLIAFVLALVVSLGFLGYAWGVGFFLFFLILFLVTWAGGIWITPFGPICWGVSWLPFLFVGILIALIMAALIPDNRRRKIMLEEAGPEARPTTETFIAVDVFFWVLIASLVAVLIIGYAVR